MLTHGCVAVSQSAGSSKLNWAFVVELLFAHDNAPPRLLVCAVAVADKHMAVGAFVVGKSTAAPAVPATQFATGIIFVSGKSIYVQLFDVPEAVHSCFAAVAADAAATTLAAAIPASCVVLLAPAAETRFPETKLEAAVTMLA